MSVHQRARSRLPVLVLLTFLATTAPVAAGFIKPTFTGPFTAGEQAVAAGARHRGGTATLVDRGDAGWPLPVPQIRGE